MVIVDVFKNCLMLQMSLLLAPRCVGPLCARRTVSSKFQKAHPRPYYRRLYEAAVAPIMPAEAKRPCVPFTERMRQREEKWNQVRILNVPVCKFRSCVRSWFEIECEFP